MLERTVGCLESGSLRRLIPSSRKSLKSRRLLHSAFWNHGAADIEFSPLWSALLRGPDSVNQQQDTLQPRTNVSGGVLLDFLYPAGTLNFIRQYSGWGMDRSDSRRGRVGLGRFGHRLYTSSAKDTSTNGAEGDIDGISDAPKEQSNAKTIKDLMGLEKDNMYDQAWRQYCLLGPEKKRSLRAGLIDYLATSKTTVHAEKLVELFEELPKLDRDSKSFESAIRSYLRLRNLSDAIRLHETALVEFRAPTGSNELLAYMVDNSLWSRALRTWKEVQELRDQFPTEYNIFGVLDRLPNLSVRAFELADYVDRRLQSAGSSEISNDEWMAFASKIIRAALFNGSFERLDFMKLLGILREWGLDSPRMYEDVLRYLIRIKQSRLVVELYRKSRQIPNMTYSRPTLHYILKIFCDHHSIMGMQQILDDFFRIYQAPTRGAYRMCMAEFASMGDADTVHALFEQFLTRFRDGRKISDPTDMAPILSVHAKRGEIGEVIKNFNEIEGKVGVRPNLLCWNILLNAFGKVNDLDGAFTCFEDLLNSKDVQADNFTFGTIMGICSSNGDLERTVELYRLADDLKIEKSNAMVDCLVLAHVQDERLKEAEKICEEALTMELDGSRTRMWNYLLVAHAMRRDLANVNRLLSRMSDANIEYDDMTYSALMHALAMVKQPDRAYALLQHVLKDAGVKATSFHYAVVMGGFITTGEYHKVFHVYNRMRRREVRTSASNSFLLMKAAFAEDDKLLTNGTIEQLSDRAFRIFEDVVGSIDPQDIAGAPQKGAGRLSVDIAYPTMFYGYVMFVLAQREDHRSVKELYEQYLTLLPDHHKQMPPTKILSAIMISKFRQRDFEGVEECWKLALSHAKLIGSPIKHIPTSISQRNGVSTSPINRPKIVHSHQLELSVIFSTYMNALQAQGRIDDIAKAVADLLDDGFLLSSKNWNIYISILAQRFRFKAAFELCESKLMPGWTGWASVRQQLPERNRLPIEVRALKKDPRFLRPLYHTVLYIARCYLELQDMAAESRASRALLSTLELDYPKTMQAIKTMPREDDDLERSILKGRPL